VKRIHIVGRKNSGKTTLITELVEHLTARGCRVGTIKHTHHHHELDTPGKDSHRHREAGAAVVGILSPGMSAVFRPATGGSDRGERYADIAPLFSNCDIVLVEGDLQSTATKVEVWRAATAPHPIAREVDSITAVVTDDPLEVGIPVWRRSDVAVLAEQLLANS
jgi:molybdopterin-guanine dinucleotide biosynthesis protein MobB